MTHVLWAILHVEYNGDGLLAIWVHLGEPSNPSVLGLENLGGNGHPTENNFPLLFVAFWMNFPLLYVKNIFSQILSGQAVNLQQTPVWNIKYLMSGTSPCLFPQDFPSPGSHSSTTASKNKLETIGTIIHWWRQILGPVRQAVTFTNRKTRMMHWCKVYEDKRAISNI